MARLGRAFPGRHLARAQKVAPASAGGGSATAGDSLTVSSTASALQALHATAGDSLTVADAATSGNNTWLVGAGDSLSVSDSAIGAGAHAGTAGDGLSVSSTATVSARSLQGGAADSLTVSSTATITGRGLHGAAGDALTVSSVASHGGAVGRSAGDSLTVSTLAAAAGGTPGFVVAPATLVDGVLIVNGGIATIRRPFADAFTLEPAGPRLLRAGVGFWGIDEGGAGYFDPHGAAPGECAILTETDIGDLVLLRLSDVVSRDDLRQPDGTLIPDSLVHAQERHYQRNELDRLFPGHVRIERPQMRSAANDRDGGHMFPGHLPPRERVVPPLPRRDDGRVHGPVEPVIGDRAYDRTADGRVFGTSAPRRADRAYQRRDDGTLLDRPGPRRAVRDLPRGDDGRVHAQQPPRRPARVYQS